MGVDRKDFNSFGSRRGNDRVMTRGTFANVRIKNLMVNGTEGGYTLYFGNRAVPAPDKEIIPAAGTPAFIYDAAMAYAQDGVPLIVIGGEDYGMGSSRDWAAKGTNLLGVKAVITKSFERIHRSNLIGMGVLPLNFADKADYDRITPLKDATFSILGLNNGIAPRQQVTLRVQPADVPGTASPRGRAPSSRRRGPSASSAPDIPATSRHGLISSSELIPNSSCNPSRLFLEQTHGI